MPREQHTADEIRAEIARILGTDPLRLPLPLRLADRDPFEADANWQIPNWPSIKGDEARVGRAIMDVKARWDLE